MSKSWDDLLASKEFNVEHALVLLVRHSLVMPVRYLYEPEFLTPYSDLLTHCHIYVIGFMPIIETGGVGRIENDDLITSWLIAGKPRELHSKIPPGWKITINSFGDWGIVDSEGSYILPDLLALRKQLGDEQNAIPFNVQYIGQAYGKNGSRQALDRLLPGHEKLQEICIKGPPEGYGVYLLLIQIEPNTQLSTMFNTKAKNQGDAYNRILSGLQKLEETTEAEKTTLYEASLIRYFKPPYNKEFKENFPSTNMTLLQGCYDKDINAIIAEINIDDCFQLASDDAAQSKYHVICHNLHAKEDRQVFFAI
ncbi:MAG: hypothetical protein SFV17_26110 [Candidatus Obscuribacter sp.]|nr:hypothetical protein [Candidatus Obscuribacter sp.]